MRRSSIAVTVVAGLAIGGGIVVSGASAASALPAKVEVVTILPNPPFELRKNGKLTGFDVQLANAAAKAGGISALEWRVSDSLSAAISAVTLGQTPMAAASLTITPTRQKQMIFSTPYLNADLAVVTAQGKKYGTGGNLSNLTVGAMKGSTSATYLRTLPGNVVEVLFPNMTAAYQALLRGTVNAVVNDYAQSDWYVQHNNGQFDLPAIINQPGKLAFAFTKDQTTLRNAINKGLAVVKQNGTLARLKNQWIP